MIIFCEPIKNLLLAILLSSFLVGCGGQDDLEDETAPPDELITPPVVPTNPTDPVDPNNPTNPTDPNNPSDKNWDDGTWDTLKWN